MSTPHPPAGPYGMYEPPPAPVESRNNTYGVVAVSLGGVGALFGLIPLTFFLAFLLGVPALVLTGFAWFKSNKVLAGFATAATVLALVLGAVGAAVMGDVANDLENLGGPVQSDAPLGSTPSPVPEPSPKSLGESINEAALADGNIPNGTWLVGEDIKPGTYRSGNDSMCYWARLSGTSGELSDVITNGIPTGPAVVTIKPSDVAFKTQGCGEWVSVARGQVSED